MTETISGEETVTPVKKDDKDVINDSNQQKSKKDDANDYTLRLKSKFVLEECSPILGPQQQSQERQNETTGSRDQNQNRNKRNKRGQNKGKKRPRDKKTDFSEKICRSTMLGKPCPFGDKCKYSHDLKEALANRPEDMKELSMCPIFKLRGYCEYGIRCRLGKCHINMATGENLRDEEIAKTQPPEVMNVLRKEVQVQLRKKKFAFVCKRHFEPGKNKKKTQLDVTEVDEKKVNREQSCADEEKVVTTNALTAEKGVEIIPPTMKANVKSFDTSPLPQKRKLIDFSNKVYIAPLTTVGNLPFRRIMKRFGADITCGEMAVAQNLLEGKSGEWALLKRHPEEDVFGVQIAAGFPDMYTRVCEVIEKEMNVDFVDLNLGCPLDLMCDKGCGASLMLRDRKLKDIVQGITNTLSCPITIKMRTGWDESKPVAHKLVSKIQSWGFDGVNALMIHGRSRLQRYTKLANWEYIETVANCQNDELPKIPVIGNGDIFTYTDYEEKVAKEGVNTTAMLARGALIKPWLPTEIKEKRHWDISATERLDILKDFTRFGLEHWGTDQQGLNNTRRFLLEWLSFLYRYIPVGMLEVIPQQMNHRPPIHMCGRSDLETLMLSKNCKDWIKISEMLLGPVPDDFLFEPKHKANSYK